MSLKERLMEDLKDSMRNKNTVKKNTVTMIRAAVQQLEVDKRIEAKDNDIIEVISKQLKEKNNSVEEFKKGDRQDLVDLTLEEIDILLEYLPEQLTEEEVEKIVVESIEEVGAKSMKDMGSVMKSVMPKVKGKSDGNVVNRIVRKKLQ